MFTYLTDSVYTLDWGGWVLETSTWVPGVHDKVPLMIVGAMPLLKHWNPSKFFFLHDPPSWNRVAGSLYTVTPAAGRSRGFLYIAGLKAMSLRRKSLVFRANLMGALMYLKTKTLNSGNTSVVTVLSSLVFLSCFKNFKCLCDVLPFGFCIPLTSLQH